MCLVFLLLLFLHLIGPDLVATATFGRTDVSPRPNPGGRTGPLYRREPPKTAWKTFPSAARGYGFTCIFHVFEPPFGGVFLSRRSREINEAICFP